MNDRRSFYFLWISQMMANGGDVLYIVGLDSTCLCHRVALY